MICVHLIAFSPVLHYNILKTGDFMINVFYYVACSLLTNVKDIKEGSDYLSHKTHVPDKIEGYMLQVRHALFELISLDNRIIGVEAYDDISVETEDTLIAEQTKSVLSKNNPVTNRAEAFWKTLFNWCNYIKNNSFPTKELVLKYVVVSTHDLDIGDVPRSFSAAATEDAARKALVDARQELFGMEQKEKKPPAISQSIKPFVDFCFASENESIMLKVILLMKIEHHEQSYDEELTNRFNMQTIPPEYATELFESMLGWVADQIHQQTMQNKPAFISSQDYRAALDIQIRSRDRHIIWSAVSTQPETYQTAAEIERHDTYIKQLELIDTDATDIFEAASDFLRTKSEKTAWAEKGLVNGNSFEEYHDGLKRLWKNNKTLSSIVATDDISKGKYVYSQCLKDVINHRLLGSDVPSFFGSGSLQELANEPSDQPTIGWHPRYVDLLKKDGGQNE